jgi:hypothetical protein
MKSSRENAQVQRCPICHRILEQMIVHPKTVCQTCIQHATDGNGEKVVFFHSRFNSENVQGYYRRDNELYPFNGTVCFIKGHRCNAVYDHIHGLIIEALGVKEALPAS